MPLEFVIQLTNDKEHNQNKDKEDRQANTRKKQFWWKYVSATHYC